MHNTLFRQSGIPTQHTISAKWYTLPHIISHARTAFRTTLECATGRHTTRPCRDLINRELRAIAARAEPWPHRWHGCIVLHASIALGAVGTMQKELRLLVGNTCM